MGKLLYQCMTKATNKESGNPRYSQNWISSRRAMFKIYKNKIKCGDWIFNINKIEKLILYKTKQGFMPISILKFEYDDQIYQFGFNPWANPMEYIELDYKTENIKLNYSKFSLIYRFLIIAILLTYLIIRYFTK